MRNSERAEYWRAHILAQRAEGSTQIGYCRDHGLSHTQFKQWRAKIFPKPFSEKAPPDPLSTFAYSEGTDFSKSDPRPVSGTVMVRRSWTREQKRELVWEGLNSGESFSYFAKTQGIHPSVMLRWLRKFAQPVLETSRALVPQFASVALVGDDDPAQARAVTREVEPTDTNDRPKADRIEIETPSGYRIRFTAGTDIATLQQVLATLEPVKC